MTGILYKQPTLSAQYPLVAQYDFAFNDPVMSTAGAAVDFGKTNLAATNVKIVTLPPGAVIVGGRVIVKTAFDAATYNVTLTDGNGAALLAQTDVKAVGVTPLTGTSYGGNAPLDVIMNFDAADACTTGRASVFIEYVIDGRTTEVV